MLCGWEGSLAECNNSLPSDGWLTVICGLTARTPGSAPDQRSATSMGSLYLFTISCTFKIQDIILKIVLCTIVSCCDTTPCLRHTRPAWSSNSLDPNSVDHRLWTVGESGTCLLDSGGDVYKLMQRLIKTRFITASFFGITITMSFEKVV